MNTNLDPGKSNSESQGNASARSVRRATTHSNPTVSDDVIVLSDDSQSSLILEPEKTANLPVIQKENRVQLLKDLNIIEEVDDSYNQHFHFPPSLNFYTQETDPDPDITVCGSIIRIRDVNQINNTIDNESVLVSENQYTNNVQNQSTEHNRIDILPDGWSKSIHNSGVSLYLHKNTKVCSLTRPYYVDLNTVTNHAIPISATQNQDSSPAFTGPAPANTVQESGPTKLISGKYNYVSVLRGYVQQNFHCLPIYKLRRATQNSKKPYYVTVSVAGKVFGNNSRVSFATIKWAKIKAAMLALKVLCPDLIKRPTPVLSAHHESGIGDQSCSTTNQAQKESEAESLQHQIHEVGDDEVINVDLESNGSIAPKEVQSEFLPRHRTASVNRSGVSKHRKKFFKNPHLKKSMLDKKKILDRKVKQLKELTAKKGIIKPARFILPAEEITLDEEIPSTSSKS